MEKILLIDANRGIYIPQEFAKAYGEQFTGTSLEEDIAILLEGPDHAEYNEAMDEILLKGGLILDGKKYRIDQDGDLWAVPEGYEEPEEAS